MTRLTWAVKRSRTIVRYEGAHVLLWRGLIKSAAPLTRLGASSIFQKTLQDIPAPALPEDVTVAHCEPPDLEAVVRLMVGRAARGGRLDPAAIAHHRQSVLERLAAGHHCYVARMAGEVVHCGWVTFDWIEWPGEHWTALPAAPQRLVLLGRDEAFHNDAYTDEAWRGRRLYTAALGWILHHLCRQGVRRLYAEVAVDNRSSAKTFERLGWQRLGTVVYARMPGSRRVWRAVVRGADPFVGQPGGYLRFRTVAKSIEDVDDLAARPGEPAPGQGITSRPAVGRG
ncbi:MAG: GNAT family N-acetyltransferase [Candidatus Rokuibacteriota bacterium]